MHLSVITATWQRPAALGHCLEQFRRQETGGLNCEHIVVSDGPDPTARMLTGRWGVRYFELNKTHGHAGAYAKDLGVSHAHGEFVCFWDDDNLYDPNALSRIHETVRGVDLGIVQTIHRLRKRPGMVTIPRRWAGAIRFGDIDTMCIGVRRELAAKERWGDGNSLPGTDFRWLQKLLKYRPRIQFQPYVIGMHL